MRSNLGCPVNLDQNLERDLETTWAYAFWGKHESLVSG